MAAVLALGSAVCWGVADFLGGLRTRRTHVLAVALVTQATGAVGIAVVVLLRSVEAPSGDLVVAGVLTGFVNVLAVCGLYLSLALGIMARVAPVFATGALVPVVVGLASGDDPSAVQALGIPLALVGVMLVSQERRPPTPAEETRMSLAIAIAIGTAVCLGLVMVGIDHVAEHDPYWAVLVPRITAAAVLYTAAVVWLRGRLATDARPPVAAVPIGVLDTSANVLFATASTLGLLSLVAVIASTFPAVTVILSLALLRDRLAGLHVVGVVATLLGCMMIVGG